MFNVFAEKVAAPELPVVVKVIAPCLPLKVDQSAASNCPGWLAEAFCNVNVNAGVVVGLAMLQVKPLVQRQTTHSICGSSSAAAFQIPPLSS